MNEATNQPNEGESFEQPEVSFLQVDPITVECEVTGNPNSPTVVPITYY